MRSRKSTIAISVLSFFIVSTFQACSPVGAPQHLDEQLESSLDDPNKDPNEVPPDAFAELKTKIFVPKCMACHSGRNPSADYDLSTFQTTVINQRVVGGDPDASLLLQKLKSGEMPPAEPLSAEEIAAVEDWILGVDPALAPPHVVIAPVASAGADQNIMLPLFQYVINGTATDEDGSVESVLWEKVSGPDVTLANQQTLQLVVENFAAGTYVFKLTATDNEGLTHFDEMKLVVSAAGNVSPMADAGADKAIQLPTDMVTLNGSGSDSDGSITKYEWTKVSGGNATLSGAMTATLTASGLAVGTYVFRLTVTDDRAGTSYDDVSVVVSAAANIVPVANAGADKTITLPTNSVSVTGTASDSDGSIASTTWSQISGPSTATISAPSSLATQLQSLVAGTYVFQLSVKDNSNATAVDSVTVIVKANVAPVASAGSDKAITLPTNSVSVTGTASDSDGSIASTTWSQISGPSTATISAPSSLTTQLQSLVAGTYVFQLSAKDNGNLTSVDSVTITVNPANNVAPMVSAGADKAITLPTNSVIVTGTASDSDGSIASTTWSQVSGPSTAIISAPAGLTTQFQSLVAGTYVFQLSAKDNSNATAVDSVTVTVTAAANVAPTANAGADKTITLPTNSVSVTGTASDFDGSIASTTWSQVSGPSNATISTPSNLTTQFQSLVAGTYVFQLSVKDNSNATAVDSVTVTVMAAANIAPTANAGADKTITLPTNSVSVTGTASDSDGSIASTTWSQISGPSTATISVPSSLTTQFQSLVAGTYIFQLSVKDNSNATAVDTVTVTVSPNTIPTANAGADKTITLPTNSVVLNGSGSDPEGAVTYLWRQVSGPNTASLTNATTANLSAGSLIQGAYVFELKVTDTAGASKVDTAGVIVQPMVGTNPNATYSWIQTNILTPRCVSCHGASSPDAGRSFNNYTNTMKSVKAGNPTGSPLYSQTNNGNMPESGSKLTAVQIQAIYDWISVGAPNN